MVYQIDVKIAGTTHAFFQRWSVCEKFHKSLTKDMKLPKGAEFKSDFPTKLKKTLEPDRLETRKLELDAYFGDLSEWGRTNGMAVRCKPAAAPTILVAQPRRAILTTHLPLCSHVFCTCRY